MKIGKIENGVVTSILLYTEMFPNVSFPPTGPDDEFLTNNGCLRVNLFKPFDRSTQELTEVAPYVEGNFIYLVQATPLSQEQIDFNTTMTRNKQIAEASKISNAKARVILIRENYYTTVNNHINTMLLEAQVQWEYETTIHRDNILVTEIQTLLGLTNTQMDDLFIAAWELENVT